MASAREDDPSRHGERIAYVHDYYDPEEPASVGSRISAHWEEAPESSGNWYGDAPEGMSLEEALRWAREHAPEVRLSIGGRQYSAGTRPLRDLPVWESHLLEELRTTPPPIVEWDVIVEVPPALSNREDAEAALRVLSQLPRASAVHLNADDTKVLAKYTAVGPAGAADEIDQAFRQAGLPDHLLVQVRQRR